VLFSFVWSDVLDEDVIIHHNYEYVRQGGDQQGGGGKKWHRHVVFLQLCYMMLLGIGEGVLVCVCATYSSRAEASRATQHQRRG